MRSPSRGNSVLSQTGWVRRLAEIHGDAAVLHSTKGALTMVERHGSSRDGVGS
jgi:hypothetical protein